QQRPCGVFEFNDDTFDPASLDAAVRAEYARWSGGSLPPRARWDARRAERILLAETHDDIYHRAVS
ncbi:hypothetical protein C6A85_70855, partial [Mycobacterium sp. ITM-2017-0098]